MSKQQDEFKMIPNSTYRLYKNGLLFNEKTLKYKKWHISNNGYVRCQIHIKNVPKMISQHRVLAELFIQNPFNKTQINHINGVKHDNRLENLEWATPSENTKHSFVNGLQIVTRPCKKVIDLLTNKIYESVTDAAIQNNISRGHLSNMLIGRSVNKTNFKFYGKK